MLYIASSLCAKDTTAKEDKALALDNQRLVLQKAIDPPVSRQVNKMSVPEGFSPLLAKAVVLKS
ncbi:hypothetical protein SERLA73DRAFT_137408 [Serpula lacrymans var. lacrymans S7.3]|uniref:Uncharacterized protein n=1 Tax=Serpula lacrymans var. lacrymans (strain S7.3) TaxID=936435 RepID=F8PZ78_SERL3|nr:hypothetical protein SERLA73DRAFT_137408 [Serpula lacrymans var. lacrymans S7.3]